MARRKTVSKTVSVRAVPALVTSTTLSFPLRGSDARSVDENSPPGTNVGNPVTAIDPDDKLTYTLSDDVANERSTSTRPRARSRWGPGPRWTRGH